MLRSLKKPALSLVPPTHVDMFVENYDQLKGWALHFTERDRELAEDLLHDTFIQFTLNKPDLAAIENVEGYLYIMMRNLHLSQIRRSGRSPLRSLSVVEFDTADVSFWASDPRDRLRMRDELGAVCQYACIRKETAKAASVLILRFFHGYYPDEIALVVRSNRSAVEKRLKSARVEVRSYLENSDSLAFIDAEAIRNAPKITGAFGEDLRFELRSQIFNSRQGECITEQQVHEIYQTENLDDALDRQTVAHIVSCQSCLDTVNDVLGLESLATRYPQDTIGKDPGKKGGDGDGGASGGGAGGSKMLDSYQRRMDAHFHHQPEELAISVNGQLQSSQRVVAGKGELTLIIDSAENLGFIEIFSEQGLRLLMLNVEPPPVGDGKQVAHVSLSNGRTIDANLNFGGPFPTLQVSYNDPQQAEEAVTEITAAPNILSVPPADRGPREGIPSGVVDAGGDLEAPLLTKEGWPRLRGRGGSLFPTLEKSQSKLNWRSWFEPMHIAIAATVLLVGILGFWFTNQPTTPEHPTARAVLKQARDAEFALAPTAEKVLHRNYQVEEWANGNLKSRKRIDEWRQVKVAARRTFDEEGQMVAGTWTKEDGSQQVFEQGERLRDVYARDVQSVPPAAGAPARASRSGVEDAGGAFIPEPTANSFANLVDRHGVTSRVTVEESPTQYIFNFEDRKGETEQRGISDRLIAAALTLDRETFNPLAQTITLQVGNELREYRFSDVVVEQKPLSEVSPLIFEPEAELAKGATKVTKPLLSEPGTVATGSEVVVTPATATLDTEVEVFKALDSVNALSGDQVSVTRTASGQLKISGIVDGNQRKTEILNALNALKNAPGVVIDVQTAAEAAKRQKQTITGDNITIESRTAEVSRQLAAEPELRSYFARRGIGEDRMAAEVRSFSASVLNRAEALSRNALALKSLAERFSRAEIDRLEPKKREEWRRLLRSKAAAVAGDVRSLQSQLSPVFGGGNAGGGDGGNTDDAARNAQRLFGLAAACERQINQSFAISSGGSSAAIKSTQFWRNLAQMADIAADLQKY